MQQDVSDMGSDSPYEQDTDAELSESEDNTDLGEPEIKTHSSKTKKDSFKVAFSMANNGDDDQIPNASATTINPRFQVSKNSLQFNLIATNMLER